MGFDITDKDNFSMYNGGMGPVFTEEDGYRNAYSSVEQKNWASQYLGKFAEANHIASAAKIYILDNWEKVDDWSELEITLTHMGDEEASVKFYNHNIHEELKVKNSTRLREMFNKIFEERAKEHNPVETFEEPVLDETDGDFSVKINGIDFYWISDRAVITIAHYIELKLNEDE